MLKDKEIKVLKDNIEKWQKELDEIWDGKDTEAADIERRKLEDLIENAKKQLEQGSRSTTKKSKTKSKEKNEKPIEDQIVEFFNEKKRLPKSQITIEGKRLKVSELTEEMKAEVRLYGRWKDSKVKKILDEYAEVDIEGVPEEHRDVIKKLRDVGLKGKKKRERKTGEKNKDENGKETEEKKKTKKRNTKPKVKRETIEILKDEMKKIESGKISRFTKEQIQEMIEIEEKNLQEKATNKELNGNSKNIEPKDLLEELKRNTVNKNITRLRIERLEEEREDYKDDKALYEEYTKAIEEQKVELEKLEKSQDSQDEKDKSIRILTMGRMQEENAKNKIENEIRKKRKEIKDKGYNPNETIDGKSIGIQEERTEILSLYEELEKLNIHLKEQNSKIQEYQEQIDNLKGIDKNKNVETKELTSEELRYFHGQGDLREQYGDSGENLRKNRLTNDEYFGIEKNESQEEEISSSRQTANKTQEDVEQEENSIQETEEVEQGESEAKEKIEESQNTEFEVERVDQEKNENGKKETKIQNDNENKTMTQESAQHSTIETIVQEGTRNEKEIQNKHEKMESTKQPYNVKNKVNSGKNYTNQILGELPKQENRVDSIVIKAVTGKAYLNTINGNKIEIDIEQAFKSKKQLYKDMNIDGILKANGIKSFIKRVSFRNTINPIILQALVEFGNIEDNTEVIDEYINTLKKQDTEMPFDYTNDLRNSTLSNKCFRAMNKIGIKESKIKGAEVYGVERFTIIKNFISKIKNRNKALPEAKVQAESIQNKSAKTRRKEFIESFDNGTYDIQKVSRQNIQRTNQQNKNQINKADDRSGR